MKIRSLQPDLPTRDTARTARLRPIVLYCGKCLKRCDNRKALRRALKEGVKERAGRANGKKARLVKAGCLGLCPKRTLVAASPSTLACGEVVLISDPVEIAAALPWLLSDLQAV